MHGDFPVIREDRDSLIGLIDQDSALLRGRCLPQSIDVELLEHRNNGVEPLADVLKVSVGPRLGPSRLGCSIH